ncbi:MAG: pyrroline-5-carboxylate reductase [Pseudomonadota bacterium]
MSMERVAQDGLVLLGCGKMGSAMLAGWLSEGLPPSSVHVIDPNPSDWVQGTGVHVNGALPESPAIVLIAVKPQMMGDALPQIAAMDGPVFLSVAAGTSIVSFEEAFGEGAKVIRAMPNTPAAVGQAITAIIGNDQTSVEDLDIAEMLLSAVGKVVRLDTEDQMDVVTGVSGSGPAYVFHMIECLAAAGEAQGLPPDLAMQLAKATVAGAGALAAVADESPAQLRVNVTSPNGTTQAALEVLMDEEAGLPPLMRATVGAASDRSRELKRGE